MKKMQAYIAIRGSANASETSDVPGGLMAMYSKTLRPVLNYRVNKTRWCVLRWPTPSMAQAANRSTEAFENFYFEVCTMDYRKMARAMVPLARRMKKADRVHLKAPGTDLTFSIKGIGAQPCVGLRNIPDGEVFSCPVKDSVNGVIQYNTPTIYSGTRFENVRLEFKDGKIIEATSSQTERLNEILDTDSGARYIGEFSLRSNPTPHPSAVPSELVCHAGRFPALKRRAILMMPLRDKGNAAVGFSAKQGTLFLTDAVNRFSAAASSRKNVGHVQFVAGRGRR